MAEKKKDKKKLKRSHKRIIRIFSITLFVLSMLHVVVYFGSDLLLRNYVQHKVEEVSGGLYEISFDRFHLSIFERGFYFSGFVLSPTDVAMDSMGKKPIYKIQAPEIAVKSIGYDFSKKVLGIGEIHFVAPSVQSKQDLEFIDELSTESRLEQLLVEIKRSVENVRLTEIIIEHLYVEKADLLIENFVSQKSIKAENTNIHIKDILMLTPRSKPTPFNAAGFNFTLENFEMLLADSVHNLQASEIQVSSLDNYIQAKSVILSPDLSKEREVYYSMVLDNLELTDADINQVFYTTDVKVGKMTLRNPSFLMYSELSPQSDKVLQDYSLYPLIKDILASISIDDLTIKDGVYLQRGVNDEYKNRIEADRIDFQMKNVYIGQEEETDHEKFFYADDAALELSSVKVVLADGVHWITGDKVRISSFEDRVDVEGAKVEPFRDAGKDVTLFEVDIPHFSLEEANLKKVYNESVLDIEQLLISQPFVKFVNIQKKEDKFQANTIKELSKDYLRAIYIQKLELQDGEMVLDNKMDINKDSISFRKVSFVMENFAVDESTEKDSTTRFFMAEALQLELDDYAMKLTDDIHLFKADKIFIDTKAQSLHVKGLGFEPLHPENVQENLRRVNKKSVLDLAIPDIYLHGVDIRKAYFDEKLEVEQIEVNNPNIKLSRFLARQEENEKERIYDIYDLATSYFSHIIVDSVSLINGSIAYDNYVRDRIKTFAENDVFIHIKNFHLDKDVSPRMAGSLFAEELDISLNNYVFNVANGKYSMSADRISYNSSKDELVTANVRLSPNRNLGMKLALSANIPSLSFKGVDMEAFLFENSLSLSKVKMADAQVNLFIDKQAELDSAKTRDPGVKSRKLPKKIDLISIDTVEASNAHFNAFYSSEGGERELINTGVNLSFHGLLLDSAKLQEGDIVSFFENMSMEIDDFSLTLKDSVHTINFSSVGLDTKSDEITFQDFRVNPLELNGGFKGPIVDAYIPRVRIKTSSLTSFQETGRLDIDDLELDQPDIHLYLDKKSTRDKENKKAEKAIQDVIKQLEIDDFRLNGGVLSIREKDTTGKVQNYSGINMVLSDLSFDLSNSKGFDKNMVLNKDFLIELPNYILKLPDSLNVLEVGLVLLSNERMVLKDVELKPRYGDYEYLDKVKYQTDVIHAKLPEVVFDSVDVKGILESKDISAVSMTINRPVINVFRDKRMPFDSTLVRPMPQELMKSSGIKMELDTIKVLNGKVVYKEFPEKGMVPGSIAFDSLTVTISPFYLNRALEDPYPVSLSELKAFALINGVGAVNMNAKLHFDDPYRMDVAVNLGEFQLNTINSILAPNAFVRVLEGVVRPSDWTFQANKHEAFGTMNFRYNQLKVMLLNERTLKKARGRTGMLNFVLNAFALRGNNPRKFFNNMVQAPIYLERDVSRFIFNYWWKLSLSGLKGSMGLGAAKKEDEEE
ncbi:hypothetical protein KZP23_03530 [Echinicola marina]|uniref:hypothetical protein n=1 Tax=Echinicola marina TaxID=2859768 RepID=UPI001CF6460C|nr:hypothetical protein [Echinicola marina]UCS94116.1 hypothetical protein KZP23_03530 [Echinicola marina]